MPDIVSGKTDGRKWIAGTIPAKHLAFLDIDTRTGQGVPEILALLKDFVAYQASKIFLPSSSPEDIEQELMTIAIIAIPDYDAAKCANMLTFLQNHIKNRIVNIYKFATEQRRTATHDNFRFCRVKCISCLQQFVVDASHDNTDKCKVCGYVRQPEDKWNVYPIAVAMVSSNESVDLPDGSQTTIQEHCSYADIGILSGSADVGSENSILSQVSIKAILDQYDVSTKQIATLLIEGYNIAEIADLLRLTKTMVRSRLRTLIKNRDLAQILE